MQASQNASDAKAEETIIGRSIKIDLELKVHQVIHFFVYTYNKSFGRFGWFGCSIQMSPTKSGGNSIELLNISKRIDDVSSGFQGLSISFANLKCRPLWCTVALAMFITQPVAQIAVLLWINFHREFVTRSIMIDISRQ